MIRWMYAPVVMPIAAARRSSLADSSPVSRKEYILGGYIAALRPGRPFKAGVVSSTWFIISVPQR
ncbi:MAG TPA: hypothetical protein VIK64_13635 [Anaerolineales bacterium]